MRAWRGRAWFEAKAYKAVMALVWCLLESGSYSVLHEIVPFFHTLPQVIIMHTCYRLTLIFLQQVHGN